jgi:hypothetical protein
MTLFDMLNKYLHPSKMEKFSTVKLTRDVMATIMDLNSKQIFRDYISHCSVHENECDCEEKIVSMVPKIIHTAAYNEYRKLNLTEVGNQIRYDLASCTVDMSSSAVYKGLFPRYKREKLVSGSPLMITGPGDLTIDNLIYSLIEISKDRDLSSFSGYPLVFVTTPYNEKFGNVAVPFLYIPKGWYFLLSLIIGEKKQTYLNRLKNFFFKFSTGLIPFYPQVYKFLDSDFVSIFKSLMKNIHTIKSDYVVSLQSPDSITEIMKKIQFVLWTEDSIKNSAILKLISEGILLETRYISYTSNVTSDSLLDLVDEGLANGTNQLLNLYFSVKDGFEDDISFADFYFTIVDSPGFNIQDGIVVRSGPVYIKTGKQTRMLTKEENEWYSVNSSLCSFSRERTHEVGPPHAKTFTVSFSFNNRTYAGTGTTKKLAKRAAIIEAFSNEVALVPDPATADVYYYASEILSNKPDINPYKFVKKLASIIDPLNIFSHAKSIRRGLQQDPFSKYFVVRGRFFVSMFYFLHPYGVGSTTFDPKRWKNSKKRKNFEQLQDGLSKLKVILTPEVSEESSDCPSFDEAIYDAMYIDSESYSTSEEEYLPAVKKYLSLGPSTAREISNFIRIDKKEVNSILYNNSDLFLSRSSKKKGRPPLWKLREKVLPSDW